MTSRVLGSSGRREKDLPLAMSVKCNTCGTTFEATASGSARKGTYVQLPMGQQITCAKCGFEDTVSNAGWTQFS